MTSPDQIPQSCKVDNAAAVDVEVDNSHSLLSTVLSDNLETNQSEIVKRKVEFPDVFARHKCILGLSKNRIIDHATRHNQLYLLVRQSGDMFAQHDHCLSVELGLRYSYFL